VIRRVAVFLSFLLLAGGAIAEDGGPEGAVRFGGRIEVTEPTDGSLYAAGGEVRVTFTAQVVPVCRGIMSCLYGQLTKDLKAEEVIGLYKDFYKDSAFVRVFDRNAAIGSMHVRGTNFCNLIVDVDARTRKLRVVSHIDNLMKGAAGSAVQCMNIMNGWEESTGLTFPGLHPI
jgi:N-acetyl-gamma-glutamyl-phosphate reductase